MRPFGGARRPRGKKPSKRNFTLVPPRRAASRGLSSLQEYVRGRSTCTLRHSLLTQALLLAGPGADAGPCELWRVDPSGWCAPWTATAVGRGSQDLGDELAELAQAGDLDAARAKLVELLGGDDREVASAVLRDDGDDLGVASAVEAAGDENAPS